MSLISNNTRFGLGAPRDNESYIDRSQQDGPINGHSAHASELG